MSNSLLSFSAIIEGPLCARLVGSADKEEKAVQDYCRLRHDYFVREKGWIKPQTDSHDQESDHYDAACHHLAVFQDERLVAYLRALPWHEVHGFMLEHDFRCLLSDETLDNLHKQQSLEISRLVLAPHLSPDAVLRSTELLFKLLYRFCRRYEIEHLYAVVEPGWMRRFRRCFHLPFQAIGSARQFPDGTRAVAAYACLQQLEHSLLAIDPLKLRWYQAS